MASSRTAAQRRRAKAIAQESTRPRVAATSATTTPDEVEPDLAWAVPIRRWPWIAGVAICLVGLGVATYLTLAHYTTSVTLACPDQTHGVINCAQVTTSRYSKILGIPVAVLGLAFFAGMLPLQLPWAWRSAHPWVRIGRLFAAVVGVGMVLWLVYAELFLIGKICIYCTSVHILTFLLFIVIVFGTIATTPEPA